MPGYGSGGGRLFVWSGPSHTFSMNRGLIRHAGAVLKIAKLGARWVRGFAVALILMFRQ
jgi:hypothetical protein